VAPATTPDHSPLDILSPSSIRTYRHAIIVTSIMHCWARYLFYAVVTVLAVGQMMVACGQTGDLYLPEKKSAGSEAQPAPPSPVVDPDAEGLEAIDDIPNAEPGPVSPQAEGL
jgi:predicted small lipoprotein YifL